MQGIEFEKGEDFAGLKAKVYEAPVAKQGFIIRLIAKAGIVDKSTANLILLSLAALFFGIAIFLYAGVLAEPAKDWALDAVAIKAMTGQ